MAVASAQESNGGGLGEESPRIPKLLRLTEEEIRAVAQKLADEPLQIPGVWGVLTAISYTARQRNQVRKVKSPPSFSISLFIYSSKANHKP